MSKQILDFFPLQDPPPRLTDDSDSTDAMNILKKVQQRLIPQAPKLVGNGDKDVKRPGEMYKRYRSPEELSDVAKTFYELAGKITFPIDGGMRD